MSDSGESGLPEPIASAPRMYGGTLEPLRLPRRWATARLAAAHTYWIATTRQDGRPHARPIWGVWLDNAFDRGGRPFRNLDEEGRVVLDRSSLLRPGAIPWYLPSILTRRQCPLQHTNGCGLAP